MTEFDPSLVAWTDQFGALLRDKTRVLQEAVFVSDLDNLSHDFQDPATEERFRVGYSKGEYTLESLTHANNVVLVLDIDRLGVNRRD